MTDAVLMVERCAAHQPLPASVTDLSLEQRREVDGPGVSDFLPGQFLPSSDAGRADHIPIEETAP